MKVTVLVENTTISPVFKPEHGLSLFIETKNHKILFDSGNSNLFIENANALGIDLSIVDIFILSHGHHDHGGGLNHFLEINKKAIVYVQQKALDPHFSKRENHYVDISVKLDKKHCDRIIHTTDLLKIDDELLLFSKIQGTKYYPLSNKNLYMDDDDRVSSDDFKHEQNLIITENNKRYLIAGCAHKGMLNIIDEAKRLSNYEIEAVLGGLHLFSRSTGMSESKERVIALGYELKSRNVHLYTCHCTGEEAYQLLKPILKDKIEYIRTGTILDLV